MDSITMKKQKQTNGKGDKSRVSDKKKFDDNWDKIFGKISDHPLGAGFAHKDIKHFADGFHEGDWEKDDE